MHVRLFFILFILLIFAEKGASGQQLKDGSEEACQSLSSMEDTIFSRDEGHFNKWLAMIVDAAAAQCPQAQYVYAQVLLKGRNVPVNIPKALKLLEASKNKEPRSKELLALIYLQESAPGAVPLDTDKGVKLLTESASAGLETSQYLLGTFYLHGDDGIKQDNLQAYYWLRRAAEQDNKVAQLTLSRIVGQGFDVPADKKASEEWECIANNQHGFDSFGVCEN